MKRQFALAALALLVAQTLWAEDTTFHQTKLASVGKKTGVDLVVSDSALVIRDPKSKTPETRIPYSSISNIAYLQSSHHRIKTGAIVMIFSLGAGAIIMATKSTDRELTIDHGDGQSRQTTKLLLNGGEYKSLIAAVESKSGKSIAMPLTAKK